jgi:23S rRNA pseudouridine1911/1915/1917 synthase
MKKYFITATKDTTVAELLNQHLSQNINTKNIISSGGIWLSKKRILDPNRTILKKQTITTYITPTQGIKYKLPQKDIIFEDNNLIAVYKPANLNTTSDHANLFLNLSHGVSDYFSNKKYIPTAITRIDYPVQGIVIFPKNKNYEKALFKAMQEHKIHKQYIAITDKNNSINRLRITNKLSFKNKAFQSENGKHSQSLFIKSDETDLLNIYNVFPFTGKRHQIRTHASQYISPIIGDKLYRSRIKLSDNSIGLIAYGYNILINKKKYRIRLPNLENEISTILNKIQNKTTSLN